MSLSTIATAEGKPNVLFISVDDLNDWIGCLGGHPQTKTPCIDRLAASGMLFTNAHCPAPACNPSRTAIMTGIAPNKSGVYENRQKMRELLPSAELLPKYFLATGIGRPDQERFCTTSSMPNLGTSTSPPRRPRILFPKRSILQNDRSTYLSAGRGSMSKQTGLRWTLMMKHSAAIGRFQNGSANS